MNNLNLLDATLRDGGNRINFNFTRDDLEKILIPLDESGIEYIEVGYRNGAIRPLANLGPTGLCDNAYLSFCRKLIKSAKMTVMAHPQNLNEQDVVDLINSGVHLLRLCVSRGKIEEAAPIVELAKKHSLQVSINFIHASQYNDTELDAVVARAYAYKPDLIYFADSNGSFLPHRVKTLYKKYISQYDVRFGFHAHDNLGLAQANTIAALQAGTTFIDSSLAGMGKGIGNLRTEFFTAYLQAMNHKTYQLASILDAANYIRKTYREDEVELDEFLRGIYDLSTAEIKAMHKSLKK